MPKSVSSFLSRFGTWDNLKNKGGSIFSNLNKNRNFSQLKGVYNFVITLKIQNYNLEDKTALYGALSEALLHMSYSSTPSLKAELDLIMAIEYLFNEIQSTESGLDNPVSK